jgi:hypothetical protein
MSAERTSEISGDHQRERAKREICKSAERTSEIPVIISASER